MENILLYGAIPILTVVLLFFIKRKILWLSPLISTALFFITYMTTLRISGMISPILKIFSNNEWRAFFLMAMLMHFGITVVLTSIACFVAYIIKRKKK